MPTAIASQIGTANWVTASVPSNRKWSFTIPEGTSRYAIAYVCPDYSDPHFTVYNEYVFEATTLDTTTYTVPCFVPSPGDVSASGSIDASAFPNTASVVIYSNEAGLGVPLTGQFTMDHSPGTSDLAALAGDASSNILAVKILRSQTFPGTINGGEPITFQASDATTLHPIAVTNAPWAT